jgi:hypothetical protein
LGSSPLASRQCRSARSPFRWNSTCAIHVYLTEHTMGATMPFSNCKVDSGLMESMQTAFHWVCKALQLNCDLEDRITEVIVTKIVELAKTGERDPEILCGKVLADLETPAESLTERAPPAERAGTASAVANGPD